VQLNSFFTHVHLVSTQKQYLGRPKKISLCLVGWAAFGKNYKEI
jgi:hypothetical protein